jgi:tripartite-type tricarboxylate transporter receptor subunit TctC
LTAGLFATRVGIRMAHVPYRGSAPVVTDVIAGVVRIMLDSVAAAHGHIRAGHVRPRAVTTAARSPLRADIPTLAETVAPGVDPARRSGIIAPEATPEAVCTRVRADIQAALPPPETRQRMIDMGGVLATDPPEAFGAFIREPIAHWSEVARAANVRRDG